MVKNNMKNCILIALLLLLLSCKKEENTNSDEIEKVETTSHYAVEDTIVADTAAVAVEEESPETESVEEESGNSNINFEKFSVEVDKDFKKAPLDWASNEYSGMFKTRIIEAYKSDKIDFAGHYIGVLFGCGAGCVSGFMIDVRDGKIYSAPLGEQNSCFFNQNYAVCEDNSRLFVSAICKENEDDEKLFYIAYLWDEDQKVFKEIESKEFITAEK
ncbi:hypothetical protein B0A66_19670 [Flavobacterium hercynium]|uniref:Lipoprotein n=2 Tax=Flavobacterium hercynium TaxID=387094 RepID=A0A226GV54_9FLAO|nr:hypothetical protein B0A66_19670 [Flavobacterium hercynium]